MTRPVARRVLCLIVCAAGPASEAARMVDLAQQRGWTVQIIATPAALDFLDPAALEQQTGLPVRSQYRTPGQPSSPKADAIIVAPATYNTINKWAAGISDTYALGILAEVVGLKIPTVVLPFVNTALAERRAFRRAVNDLRDEGIHILLGPGQFEPHPPGTGKTRIGAFPWTLALDETERLTTATTKERRNNSNALNELLARTRHLLFHLDAAKAPPAYLLELLAACRESGRTIAIISEAAARDVDEYLNTHGLDRAVDLAIGQTITDHASTGTTTCLITQALTRLDANTNECAIISNSSECIDAARTAGVATIGNANEPAKYEPYTAAGADSVVASLANLAVRLRASKLKSAKTREASRADE